MDLTPETLRSATFRDKLRGYHPDDVDEFLESVARGLEVLLARLRDATEKARAMAPAPPDTTAQSDAAVKTLALAQRTADLAIQEAKAEGERLIKAAEQKTRRMLEEAQNSAAELAEAAQSELRSDLERLQVARDQLIGEVQTLGSWLEGERGRIRGALIELADRIDTVREAGDAPAPKPVSVPAPPRDKLAHARANSAPAAPPAPAPANPAPATAPAPPTASAAPPPTPAPAVEHPRRASTPPVERPKANVTPPTAAPAPYQKGNTPPGGQPAVRPSEPRPAPAREIDESSDAAVLNRAQQGTVNAADDDPFFAELRAAMLDQSPLGPRDDNDQPS